jgi:hypothetical protein
MQRGRTYVEAFAVVSLLDVVQLSKEAAGKFIHQRDQRLGHLRHFSRFKRLPVNTPGSDKAFFFGS